MTTEMTSDFQRAVETGLSASEKRIPSKFLYDERGDEWFVKIMGMPEYYPTDCEFEILTEQCDRIISSWGLDGVDFEVYELGAGDGTKTIELLRHLPRDRMSFYPIDISANALAKLEERLAAEVPGLRVQGMLGDYFEVLRKLRGAQRKVMLFLGSNLGNLGDAEAHAFINGLAAMMAPRDQLLLGLDWKKPAAVVLPAYDDPHGYTREFNLNLLRRINRELDGRFDVEAFSHLALYDETAGIASSYLVSRRPQEVWIGKLGRSFAFAEGERIHVEISRKYDWDIVDRILDDTGLVVRQVFTDRRGYFVDLLIEKDAGRGNDARVTSA